ncbi:DUF6622 family protein [Hydrogenophaga sp.]|uniref:DUF6622 family protein n=1 Tax=Hydrogenophaga sp. TaxID=1904254 RepID=UPI003D27B7C2
MLLSLVSHHPEAVVPILRGTPLWVWGLLVGLVALGVSQLRDRTASLARVSLLPLIMTTLSVSGTFSALGSTPHRAIAILAWLAAAALAFVLLSRGQSTAQYDPARGVYRLPGSVVPLLLILGIFLVKYVVGVDLAMEPAAGARTHRAVRAASRGCTARSPASLLAARMPLAPCAAPRSCGCCHDGNVTAFGHPSGCGSAVDWRFFDPIPCPRPACRPGSSLQCRHAGSARSHPSRAVAARCCG